MQLYKRDLITHGSRVGARKYLCRSHRGIAMRAPSIPCRRAVTDEGSDIVARGNVLAGVCMSALVWALAIANMIDLCGLR